MVRILWTVTLSTIRSNFERRPPHGSLSVNNKPGRGGARHLARLAGAEKVKIENIFLKSGFASQLSPQLSQQFVWLEQSTESQLFSVIGSFLRDKMTIVASFFLSRPFSCVSSTFPLTENFDESLFYPVTQHSPQPLARVSPSKQGGVYVVPPFLDVPHVLGGLDHEALSLRDGGVAGLVELVVHQPAGQGGAASPRLSSGASGARQAAVQGGAAASTGQLELEGRGRALRPVDDAVLRPRPAHHQHGVSLRQGRRGGGRRGRGGGRYWVGGRNRRLSRAGGRLVVD